MIVKTRFVLPALLILVGGQVAGQSLEGRHMVELRLGAWNQVTDHRTSVGPGGVSTSADASGFLGGLGYGYGIEENLALRIDVGLMAGSFDTDVGAAGVSTELAIVTPLLVGLRYYLSGTEPTSKARPFLGASAGAFVGTQSSTQTGLTVTVEERTESAVGVEAGAGVDLLFGRHFLLSVLLAYDAMTDFDRPIGGSENYSGPHVAVGFAYVFGS
jgi:outer membrane protein W